MTWLFFLGLLVWTLFQQARLNDLRQQLSRLTDQVARLMEGGRAPRAEPRPALPSAAQAESALVEAVELTLPPSRPAGTPGADRQAAGANREAGFAAKTTVAAPRAAAPARSTLEWLSENGLAWLGGGALALGGLLLVAFAVQRGFFTPAMRIASASILGLAAIGVGEWLRRRKSDEEGYALVAALTTAAGAAILYAAVWAAQTLYGFIPPAMGGFLLAAVSISLIGLAFLHGEPLGLLGVLGAFAAPAVSGSGPWSAAPLDVYLLLIAATGAIVAALRRWAGVAAITLACLALWTLFKAFGADAAGVAILAAAGPALMAACDLIRRRGQPSTQSAKDLFGALPSAAVITSSLFVVFLYFRSVSHAPLDAGLAAVALAGVVAIAVQRGLAPAILLLAPALVVGLWAETVWAGFDAKAAADGRVLVLLTALAAVGAAGLQGGLTGARSLTSAVIGAGACAVVLSLIASPLAHVVEPWGAATLAAFAILLAAGAIALAERSGAPEADPSTAAWIAAAAVASGLFAHAVVDARLAPTAFALIGLALSLLRLRWKWRGLAESAAASCLVSLAAFFAPPLAGAAMAGKESWLLVAGATGAATAVQAAVWRILKRPDDAAASAEAASTGAILSGLTGAFLVLRTLSVAVGGHGALLDPFTESSFRTILMLAAGLVLTVGRPSTVLGRVRAPALLAAGALHGLLLQAVLYHPWWGAFGAAVDGPPILDSLLLGLLAPALILAEAARRSVQTSRQIATPTAAVALLFLLLWAISEVRRLFHGPLLAAGAATHAEVAAYAIALMATALPFELARARIAGLGFGRGLGVILDGLAWAAAALSLWLVAFTASPWWGPIESALRWPALFGAACLIVSALAGVLAFVAAKAGRLAFSRFATVAAGLEIFVLVTLIVRYGFHGVAMRAALHEASLETWTYSAVWALYGLMVLAIGARQRLIALRWLGLAILLLTTGKVFLFDMAQLAGVIRAGSFLALGVVLLIGALAARRFGQPTAPAAQPPASPR